jgi:hypothetical protein
MLREMWCQGSVLHTSMLFALHANSNRNACTAREQVAAAITVHERIEN